MNNDRLTNSPPGALDIMSISHVLSAVCSLSNWNIITHVTSIDPYPVYLDPLPQLQTSPPDIDSDYSILLPSLIYDSFYAFEINCLMHRSAILLFFKPLNYPYHPPKKETVIF